jgi:hypothetical protein
VLPGTYQATVTAEAADPSQQSLIPLRYTRAGSSGLSVTIFPDSKAPVKLELVSDDAAADDVGGKAVEGGDGAAGPSPAGEAAAGDGASTGGADREQSQSPTVN